MGKCASVSQKHDSVVSSYSCPDIDDIKELENLKQIPNYLMNPASRNLIISALNKNHLFRDLATENIENLLKSVKFCVAEENQIIFTQGSKGSLYFIINSGQVKVFVDNKLKGILNQEDCFGEMALLTDSKRKATIKTIIKSSFWVISSLLFFKALKSQMKKNHDYLRKLIQKSIFFKDLSDSQIDVISKISVISVFEDHQNIIREGDQDDLIYILKSGIVSVKKGSKEFLRVTEEGEIFGEGAIFNKSLRNATCTAIGRVEVISLNFGQLKSVFKSNNNDILLMNIAKNSIMSDEHLGFIEKSKIISICFNLTWSRYKEGEKIFDKTEKKFKSLFIICAGGIRVEGQPGTEISQYQVIGLGNKNQKNLITGTYAAVGDTIIGTVPIKQIDEILEVKTSEIFDKLDRIKFLKSINSLNSLSYASLNLISSKMVLYTVLVGTKVFEANQVSSKIYLVKSGVIEIYNEKMNILRIIKKNDSFGERCLYEQKRSATAICVEEAEVYAIHKSILIQLIEYKDLIEDAKRKVYYQRPIVLTCMKLRKDYMIAGGRKKYVIKDTVNSIKYDLILIPKFLLETERDCFKLVKEKDIMIEIDCRQIVKLVCTAFDINNLYFITEHIKGSSLKFLVSDRQYNLKSLTLHLVKILEYLQNKNIAHRDFSIDNIIISTEGIPYLQNFQSAKIIDNRAYTRLGNPFYRSPEMILGRGYTKSTDLWSLGVIVYELAYGCLPFQMSLSDKPMEIYQKILGVKHGVDSRVDELTNNFILELLCEHERRIDIQGILRNRWFSDLDLNDVVKRRASVSESVFFKEIKEPDNGKVKGKIERVLMVMFR